MFLFRLIACLFVSHVFLFCFVVLAPNACGSSPCCLLWTFLPEARLFHHAVFFEPFCLRQGCCPLPGLCHNGGAMLVFVHIILWLEATGPSFEPVQSIENVLEGLVDVRNQVRGNHWPAMQGECLATALADQPARHVPCQHARTQERGSGMKRQTGEATLNHTGRQLPVLVTIFCSKSLLLNCQLPKTCITQKSLK